MFYYVKMVGDEPFVVESEKEIKKEDFSTDPEKLYFLVVMQGPNGQTGMHPLCATDNGLANSKIDVYSNSITMISKLGNNSPIVEAIKRVKEQKLGIVRSSTPSIIT